MVTYVHARFHIKGTSPLLMHNGRLASPLDQYAKAIKEISSKPKKTDQDYEQMAWLEFQGSLYLDNRKEPCIPGTNLQAMIIRAAQKQHQGPAAKAGVLVEDTFPLLYEGPRTAKELFAHPTFVDCRRVTAGTSTVFRTRPIFPKWELKFEVAYLPDVVNESDLIEWVKVAGALLGLGDYTPKFGRFLIAGIRLLAA
jgi:hypothetical protein